MAQAKERQPASRIYKQIVGGKEWSGPPFLCKPSPLAFADFEVGQTYQLHLTLTNVSYTFNSFRPQNLPDAVCSSFEHTHALASAPALTRALTRTLTRARTLTLALTLRCAHSSI